MSLNDENKINDSSRSNKGMVITLSMVKNDKCNPYAEQTREVLIRSHATRFAS